MLKNIFIALALTCGVAQTATAQIFGESERNEVITYKGQKIPVLIRGNDTFIVAALDEVKISGSRLYKNDKERHRFIQMQYNAKKVLPYAVEAFRLYEDMQADTRDLKAGKKRRRVNDMQKEVKSKFEKPLKGLYRSQGAILIKMLERAAERPMYSVISEYKGGLDAFYWNTLGSFYDYNLRTGYDAAADPLMESVLAQYDLHALAEQLRQKEAANKPK
jgi:Domain of unknown function (DUF4294)